MGQGSRGSETNTNGANQENEEIKQANHMTKPKPLGRPKPALEPGVMRTLSIDGWHPATVNQIYGNGPRWWKGHGLKTRDKKVIAKAVLMAGDPGLKIDRERPIKRRVHMTMYMAKGQIRPDKDGVWKSILDALKHAGCLANDSPNWCEHTPVVYERNSDQRFSTVILLEDI